MSSEKKTVVVTGGAKGIGKAIGKKFVEQNNRVYLLDNNEKELKHTQSEFQRAGLPAEIFTVDVTDTNEVKKVFEQIFDQSGSLDVLINNAGIIRDNLFFKMQEEDWDAVIKVHLKGAYNCCHAAQEYMVSQKWGRIINISSASALGNRGQANYATAKAGIQGLTKTLAIELGKFNITVNAVAPGFIESDMTREAAKNLGISFEELIADKAAAIPVRRAGKPEDIAEVSWFFSTEAASFVSGQILYAAGGPKA
ncbi:SDR family oxidoreductase [Alkalicoccus saliphilus]|uniref:Beta-ketoacyl-ACP reductase n=1 Tax=Alkalicoccus saliphilus TaxID=200989 RepID=A0A2T4U2Y2_9BACI|nr:SDR family NAD(P)-dependent oxidoreductase [Alkalicoccus saliphilus]PTL37762.1 beta-ketoacyl-ACP reductase [Alkalicoccus saliphilus]